MSNYNDFKQIVEKRKIKNSRKRINLVARQAEQANIDIILTEKTNSKSSKKSCIMCGGAMGKSQYENVCSRKCSEQKLMYNFINIPDLFAKRLIQHSKSINDIYDELDKFADRHKYSYILTIKKFKNCYLSMEQK